MYFYISNDLSILDCLIKDRNEAALVAKLIYCYEKHDFKNFTVTYDNNKDILSKNIIAQFFMGKYYLKKYDYQKALDCFQESAKQGYSYSKYKLFPLYESNCPDTAYKYLYETCKEIEKNLNGLCKL